MPDTTRKYRIYHYDIYKGYELVEELNIRNTYEPVFWKRPMPKIGDKRCKKILKKIHPWFDADSVPVLIEDVETGFKHTQNLYRNGTIITG